MRKFLAPFVATAAAALVLAGCGKPEGPPQMPAPEVSVATPLRQSVVDWDDFTGRFEAPERVDVRARAGGYLQTAHFREGQYVRKGQLLFTLDPRPAEAQLAAARAQAKLAAADLARAETLLKVQAISREEYDNKRAASEVAQATVQARALDLEFTRVTAPTSGVVSDRRVDPGNVISGGGAGADVLTTIVSTTPIHFEFDASEAQLLKDQRQTGKGGKVQIRLQDEADYRWTGQIDFTDNSLDSASGAVRMRAVVANPNGFLKPGMYGKARVEGGQAYDALLVPEDAIVADGARKAVNVVNPDGTVTLKPVQLGPLSEGLRVIRSGVKPDDKVIVNGGVRLMGPNMKVQAKLVKIEPKKAAEPSTTSVSVPVASSATPASAR
ncbi:efflux RND transporter periplasmic adaptor subunit [Phenylobacterium sp.]|uniref:efflux RND transporter periplasmic adaptor subunit n=1 Tax=Phenylobacterium sp. TaxID=1871053 RepID=UPI00289E08C7|nr:efflux RND transporter periplasmic adaptor subunit [Phenylobacterium sp.]